VLRTAKGIEAGRFDFALIRNKGLSALLPASSTQYALISSPCNPAKHPHIPLERISHKPDDFEETVLR
jgi:hypothetical protein